MDIKKDSIVSFFFLIGFASWVHGANAESEWRMPDLSDNNPWWIDLLGKLYYIFLPDNIYGIMASASFLLIIGGAVFYTLYNKSEKRKKTAQWMMRLGFVFVLLYYILYSSSFSIIRPIDY